MRHVHGSTSCSCLIVSERTVCDDQRVRCRVLYGRQEHQLAYLHRDIEMIVFEAEALAIPQLVENLQASVVTSRANASS